MALLDAVRAALEKDDLRAGDFRELVEGFARDLERFTLEYLVACWGWRLVRDKETGEFVDIRLEEEVAGDAELLFEVLGPYVMAGCYVTLGGNASSG